MNCKPKSILLIKANGRQYELASQLSKQLLVNFMSAGIEVDIVDKGTEYDLAIAIGGDATMMKTVTKLSQRNIPTLGINAGDLGFLTTAETSEWELVVSRVIKGDFYLEQRLGLELHAGSRVIGPIANDVVLRHRSSVATFEIAIGGQIFYPKLVADGVMVATATGSTGYNVSAHGPIILPSSTDVVVTTINPTMLTSRPIVAPEVAHGKSIDLKLLASKRDEPVIMSADGVPIGSGLMVGDTIRVFKHPKPLLFATFGLEQYARALTEKKGLAR